MLVHYEGTFSTPTLLYPQTQAATDGTYVGGHQICPEQTSFSYCYLSKQCNNGSHSHDILKVFRRSRDEVRCGEDCVSFMQHAVL